MSVSDRSVPRRPAHIVDLDGLRAVAAFGIILTHVAFQTGTDPASPVGAILARFDFFVAVFYALSAFLLWRSYRDRLLTSVGRKRYAVSRCARILPAFFVCAAWVIIFLPESTTMTWSQVVANLTLTQIYIPDGLVSGLTHLWSLCVEVVFYFVLPLLAVLIGPRKKPVRVAVILGLAILSLGWGFLPFVESTPADGVANRQIWPPAYLSWFAVGMIAAECEGHVPPIIQRLFRIRWLWWFSAIAIAWVAGQEWFGPLGLTHPGPAEFSRRMAAGCAFGFVLVVPYALAPSTQRRRSFLTTSLMTTLGSWSYSIFLWHVAVLAMVFPMLGVKYFSGGFLVILLATVAITLVVAAASYSFVEVPGARWIKQANAAKRTTCSETSSPA